MVKLILASNNAKKLAELRELFAPLGIEVLAQASLGVAEAAEPHDTFVENALAKARHAAHASGCAALADDSGLCVAALNGAPGVASANYALSPASTDGDREAQRARQDRANNTLLLERMERHTERRARFVSTLVALRDASDPEPLIAYGRWEGEILREPRGGGGFGYDPLVFIPALGQSVAQLDAARKCLHSHRALAARRMLVLMRELWRL